MSNEFDLEEAINELASRMAGESKNTGPVLFQNKEQVLDFLKDARIPEHTPEEAYELLLEEGFIAIGQ